jgi:hypothetical protein
MSDNEDCDLECFFGILKLRFRCIFHNMILSHEELDTRWEDSVNWSTLNPDEVDRENEDDPTGPAFVG